MAGDIFTLLVDVPYFFPARIIPPLLVVNEVLRTGLVDAGMSGGCEWKPFQIEKNEYEELVKALKKERFKAIIPPAWVETERDWHSWCDEMVWGIPALEYSCLSDEIHKLEQERVAALKVGDKNLAHKLHSQLNDRLRMQMGFINKHRLSRRKIPSTASLRYRLHMSRVARKK